MSKRNWSSGSQGIAAAFDHADDAADYAGDDDAAAAADDDDDIAVTACVAGQGWDL